MRPENIPFRLESELFKAWYRLSGRRPSSSPFVSGDSFRALANHIFEPSSQVEPQSIKAADVVFVQSSELERFRETLLPELCHPVVLVTHNGDLNITERFSGLVEDRRLLRWFAQNALLRHPKLTALPIGLENRCLHSNGVLRDFVRLRQAPSRKKNRILFGFTVSNNPSERAPAEKALRGSPLADETSRQNARRYRQLLREYAFVASPPGNGVDCHRTWEALYLGVIPIVKRSSFYESFPAFPFSWSMTGKRSAIGTKAFSSLAGSSCRRR